MQTKVYKIDGKKRVPLLLKTSLLPVFIFLVPLRQVLRKENLSVCVSGARGGKGGKSERFKCESVQWELRGDGRCACDFNKWEDD